VPEIDPGAQKPSRADRFLKNRGVNRLFGLQGGHVQPIWDHVARAGIQIVDVRDEGAAVHMAHAHAELTGELGVAMVTAGPGVTNCVTAMANASIARVPVLLIGGCPPRPQVNMGPLQDIPHVDILRPLTRAARTARVAEQVLRELDELVARAEGDAVEPGPVISRSNRRCAKPCQRLILEEHLRANPGAFSCPTCRSHAPHAKRYERQEAPSC
jgi:acetolactate synthase-1/2/3 large subunit